MDSPYDPIDAPISGPVFIPIVPPASAAWGDSLCGGKPFGPFANDFVTYCFVQLVLFGLAWIYWCGAFIYQFWVLRKVARINPRVTRWHWAELLMNLMIVLLHACEFIWAINASKPGFAIFGSFFLGIAWLGSLSITYNEYKRGMRHGWPIISWLVLAFVIQSLKVQSIMDTIPRSGFDFINSVILFVLYGILGIASFVHNVDPPAPQRSAFRDIMDESSSSSPSNSKQDAPVDLDPIDLSALSRQGQNQGQEQEQNQTQDPDTIVYGAYPPSTHSPEEQASIFSLVLFSWLTPLLELGYTRPLQAQDLPKLSKVDETTRITDSLEENWLAQVRLGHDNASFFKALVSTYGASFGIAGLFKVFQDILLFVGPLVLRQLIKFIETPSQPFYQGVLLALAMGSASVLQSLLIHTYFFRVFRVGQQLRASIASLVYRKAFKMSFESRKKYTVGEIVNHQSIDTSRLDGTMPYLHMIWSGPFQMIVSLILLYQIVGVAVFAGLAVLLLLIPINIKISRVLGDIQKQMMGHKDARNKIINEVLQGIRVIKYFAWEKSFEKKVSEKRQIEIDTLRRSAMIRSWTSFLWVASPIIVSLSTFGVFTAMGNKLTAEIAFTSLALFNILRFPINALPTVISSIVECQVSVARLRTYLLTSDIDETAVEEDINVPYAVQIKDAAFEWEPDTTVLSDINITIPKGKLVAIVGEVGCGKSSILSALLGEMPKIRGRVVVNGTIAYCPQQAWIQNTTVRNNITFGLEYDPAVYEDAIQVCELKSDMKILPAGDQTEIGEKGINLSGGQKQRISLARSVYQQADIYLLDDPLSAVDAHVGKCLFENCIRTQLQGKTRILVTHQLQFLSKVDHVIVMASGRISEQGSYDQLMQNPQSEFYKLIKSHVHGHDEDHHTAEQAPSSSEPTSEESTTSSSLAPSPVPGRKDDASKKPDSNGKSSSGALMMAEERSTGSVDISIYLSYAKAIGGFLMTAGILGFFVLDSGSKIGSDWWLSIWAAAAERVPPPHSMGYYLGIYAVFAVSNSIFILIRNLLLIVGGMRAAVTIHENMLRAVLRSPISWFDQVPLGRILNRFSKDQYAADESILRTLSMALGTLFGVISIAIVVGSVTPWILVAVLPLAFLYRYIQQYYLQSSRELQRLSSISRSPIFALFSETLSGISTIRGYGKSQAFIELNEDKIDENQKAHFLSTTSNRWLGLRLEFVGTCVVFGAAFFAVVSRNSIQSSLAGLSITYALQLTSQLNWLVRMSTDVENELVSVERCVQYSKLEPEAEPIVEPRPPISWPSQGAITFNNLSLRYREGLPLVLRNITCNIKPQEKIGVVGRTGAGKSSLMNALFRITEAAEGSITIDGIDTSRIGLEDLRSKLAIIPQDPTLFTGTVRSNLDPFDQYTDAELWAALDAVHLKDQIEAMPLRLDAPITEFGENLSVGSRQLMCLARALLKKPKILVMDEATASIDYKSDEKIQKAIREQFKNATVLTIAHRIATIADSDRVMVLDFGQLVEFDSPENLMKNPNGIYASLARKSKKNKEEAKQQQQE